jgi:cytidyltransferase-like protein
MEIIGIIAEYNPFHNGHLYQINKIKEMYPDSIIVVVMNGNFSQRGEACIIDKYKRCEIALKNKVDLVIELPFVFGVQSADIFAHGAMYLLNELKVEKLVFGSETNDISLLTKLANIQINNSDYENKVKEYMNNGYNYPTSMSKALKDLSNIKIEKSNDLLGLSYIKEIIKNNYNITPISIKRTNDYNSKVLNYNISSASSIREAINNNIDIKNHVPIYDSYFDEVHLNNQYFPLLKYKIMTDKNLEIYQTVDEGIENRINKYIVSCNDYETLIKKVKTKRYTYNKINRMLCHILCSFTKEEALSFKNPEYIRVLGFNETGKKYLNKIKKEVTIPIVTRYAALKNNKMLNIEYRTTKVYYSIIKNNNNLIESEYKKSPIYYK